MTSPYIETLCLRVCNPYRQTGFYREFLGMRDFGSGRVGYASGEAAIQFEAAESPYEPQPDDVYWKIAIAVPNIELAVQQLADKGISVGTPTQFQDIGYLAHLRDPEGFAIELIEHYFEGDRPDVHYDESLFGGGAHFNLITLRCADIEATEHKLLQFGMTPLSIQPVEGRGFTLYFYAFTDERPPNSNLQAIENRTWVYQRPYTVLEVQHLHEAGAVRKPNQSAAGYAGMLVKAKDSRTSVNQLLITNVD